MSVTSGFFNSLNGDRRYNAEQMSAIFDGIISDGVYASVGTAFAVSATTGNIITIGTGRSWFNHTWVYNDAILSLTAEAPDVVLNRYDTVVIEIDHSDSVRMGSIKIVTGVAAADPVYPTLINTTDVHQYPIAYIYRPANSSAITQSNIEYNVGTDECPYVTGPLEVHSIENIVAQWRSQFYDWLGELQVILGDDVATELASRIIILENKVSTASLHRSNFRGENLGSEITTEQLAAIEDGSFRNLFVGDYWEIDGIKWRIVDFDYWYKTGDTTERLFTNHHAVIMPDSRLYTAVMNSDATNSGGYVGSEMYTTNLEEAKTIISATFGDKLLTHRELLVTDVYDSDYDTSAYGRPQNNAWFDSTVELPNEYMIYGHNVRGWLGETNSKTQLALFKIMPEYIMGDGSYWLRDTAHRSSASFANVQGTGIGTISAANVVIGVRPVFAIG